MNLNNSHSSTFLVNTHGDINRFYHHKHPLFMKHYFLSVMNIDATQHGLVYLYTL